MSTRKTCSSAAAVIVLALAATAARAETVNCTRISAIPTRITQPGVYCLKNNLTTSSVNGAAAIDIAASDVVLDLNGFTLSNSAWPNSFMIGISSEAAKNVTVKNGTVSGFYMGVSLQGDFAVYRNSATANTIEGITAVRNTWAGLYAVGNGNVIRNNRVHTTGGVPNTANSFGIFSQGPAARIIANEVDGTYPPTTDFKGIIVDMGPGAVVDGNRIGQSGEVVVPWAIGIFIETSGSGFPGEEFHRTNALVTNNTVSNFDTGVSFVLGATGKYRGNLMTLVTHPFLGTGTDAGGNN